MYLNFYNLKKEPFNVTPDPEFLFLSESHKEALGAIIYGVEKKKGFITITGEVGVGKTTILRSYLEKISRQQLKIVYIFNANVSFQGLLKTVYRELDIDTETDDVYEMVNNLQMVLIEEYKHGRNVVLIVDEAQNMPIETQENLRMLSNLETSTDKLIQIVLVGQPEFEDLLNLHELRQLKQRIAVRTTIGALSQEESMAYIQHRLSKVAIDDTPIFTNGALKLIAKKSKGTPRVLNILCDNALITGYGYQKNPVNTRIVKEVISDFEGKRRYPFLRWGIIASSTLIILLLGLFWVYPKKTLILTQMMNFSVPHAVVPAKSKEESKLIAEKATSVPIININQISTTTQNTRTSVSLQAEQTNLMEDELESSLQDNTHGSLSSVGNIAKFDKINHNPYATDEAPQSKVQNFPSSLNSESEGRVKVVEFSETQLGNAQLVNGGSSVTEASNDKEFDAESLTDKLEDEKNELEGLKIKFQELTQLNEQGNLP